MTIPPQLPSLVHRVRMGSRAVSAAVGSRNGRVSVSNWIIRRNGLSSTTDGVATVRSVLRRTLATSTTTKDRLASLQASGWVDDDGLTSFTTLHELQVSACQVFANNHIFGTFAKAPQQGDKGESPAGGAFEWMTYHEFSALVDQTRSVLKDIGTS
jgi:hypothetical protein